MPINPCTGAPGATPHWTCIAANPPGHTSPPGTHGTGGKGSLPAGRPIRPVYQQDQLRTREGYRGLTDEVLTAAARSDVVRDGSRGSAWFAHRDPAGLVIHVDVRGPTCRPPTGGRKSLFCFSHGKRTRRARLVLAEAAIDALSRAAIERLREDTIYAATAGGIGPSSIAALKALLLGLKESRDALLESAADANPAGDRYAARHQEVAEQIGVPFRRLRPPIEGGDWNDVLKASVQGDRRHEA